jgi:aspartate/methionine/tyrosine aminotransferase
MSQTDIGFSPAARLKNVSKSAIRRIVDAARPGSINLGIGEPDFLTPEVIRNEACRVINDEKNGYTMNAGLNQLRHLIAEYHSEGTGRTYRAEDVCVTTGVEEALFATVMSIAGPGDEVVLADPGFLAYPTQVSIAGAIAKYYRMPASERFGFDAASFDRAVSDRTRLVFVTSPSNPTGRVMGRDDLQHIARRLQGTGAIVISDEIYRELYFDERPASIAQYYPDTIILSGLSKMMSMTGWRIGWAVGPEEVIRSITVMHQYATSCASTISQKAAVPAFGPEGRRATEQMRIELARRGQVMARAIEREIDLPYVLGEGAFYIMLDISSFGTSESVAMALLDESVITAPGGAFGSEAEGYLRLSFSIEPSLIEDGIKRIARGLSRFPVA